MSRRLSLVVQEPNSSLELIPGVQQQDVVMGTPELLHLRVPEKSNRAMPCHHVFIITSLLKKLIKFCNVHEHNLGNRPCMSVCVCTGVDRWGTGGGGTRPPHFSGWGTAYELSPPPFSSEKLRGIQPDSTLLSLNSRYIGQARQ